MFMAAKYLYIILVSLPLLVISCFEEDERVPPYPGEVITVYDNIEFFQSYFDFETGEIVSSQPADLWALGFECSDSGWHILTNSGANWFIWNSGQTNIDASLSYPENELWAFDIQSTYPDSTAVGNWLTIVGEDKEYTNNVYVLGRYHLGSYTDMRRIQFIEVSDSYYRLIIKKNVVPDTIVIQKDKEKNFTYYSFETDEQLNLEPGKFNYDLMFGPYYDIVTEFNITQPYLVRGVLLNSTLTLGVLDSINAYDAVTYAKLDTNILSSQRDVIGFQWKDVNVNTSTGSAVYTVKPNYTYIVKTSDNNYYKLRFLSFNLEGYSGHPRFEFKKLIPLE